MLHIIIIKSINLIVVIVPPNDYPTVIIPTKG